MVKIKKEKTEARPPERPSPPDRSSQETPEPPTRGSQGALEDLLALLVEKEASLRSRAWDVAVRDREIERLSAELAALGRRAGRLRTDQTTGAKRLSAQLEAARLSVRELEDRLAELSSASDRERTELDERTRHLQTRLDTVVTSRSWRLTRPLRRLREALLRRRRPSEPTGRADPATASPTRDRFLETVSSIEASGLFDADFYRKRHPELADSDPLLHYLERPWSRDRNPNPFFDTAYYLDGNPDVEQSGDQPLEHFIVHGAREGRKPHRLFDPAYYLEHNVDVEASGANPLRHFLEHGMAEGRQPCSPADALGFVSPYAGGLSGSPCFDYARGQAPALQARDSRPAIGLYTHRLASAGTDELRDLLAAGLGANDLAVELLDERSPVPENLSHHLILAPHEFFALGGGVDPAARPELARAVLINTERINSQGFVRALPHLLRADLVLDFDPQMAAVLGDLGIHAHFLPLGWVDGLDWLGKSVEVPRIGRLSSLPPTVVNFDRGLDGRLDERPLDLLAVGTLSDRRAKFFSNAAATFATRRSFFGFYEPEEAGGARMDEPAMRTVAALSQRSRILLHVHRDDSRSFDWRRVVLQGMLQKTVVVTEPGFVPPRLVPGEHFVAAELDRLPEAVEWLLESEDGRRQAEKIRHAAFDRVLEVYDLKSVLARLIGRLPREATR